MLNSNVQILLVSHDWAQHDLKAGNKDKFTKNISSITKKISNNFDNVETLHVNSEVYSSYGVNYKKIYKYPKDLNSHLQDYEILSIEIAKGMKLFFNFN